MTNKASWSLPNHEFALLGMHSLLIVFDPLISWDRDKYFHSAVICSKWRLLHSCDLLGSSQKHDYTGI